MKHYDSIQIGNIFLGDGVPKICVPIVAKERKDILDQAIKIKQTKADLVEWRIDCMSDPFMAHDMVNDIKDILDDIPLLVTFRTHKEGGQYVCSEEAYEAIYNTLLEDGQFELLDVEYFISDSSRDRIVEKAHEKGIKIIMSNHDFEKTPPKEEMISRLRGMQTCKADITKLAVMPKSQQDVIDLLEISSKMDHEFADRPFITMSMGALGMISRVSGSLTGSALTFGSFEQASAPGQINISTLATILDTLQISKKSKKMIYLIGFMGSGKSTIAGKYSEKHGVNVYEMDEEIVKEQGVSITEIFETRGETYFRALETALLRKLSKNETGIVSCGGGVAIKAENVDIMKKSGKIILLKTSPEQIYERVKNDNSRPLLNGNMNISYIEQLMERRREAYEKAADYEIVTDHKTIDEIIEEIEQIMK